MGDQTAREALEQVFHKHNPLFEHGWQAGENFKQALLAWHDVHQPQVTREQVMREQVIRIIQMHLRSAIPSDQVEAATDSILALLTGEPKKWCEHMRYLTEPIPTWVYLNTLHGADLWQFCPSCGTPRPAG